MPASGSPLHLASLRAGWTLGQARTLEQVEEACIEILNGFSQAIYQLEVIGASCRGGIGLAQHDVLRALDEQGFSLTPEELRQIAASEHPSELQVDQHWVRLKGLHGNHGVLAIAGPSLDASEREVITHLGALLQESLVRLHRRQSAPSIQMLGELLGPNTLVRSIDVATGTSTSYTGFDRWDTLAGEPTEWSSHIHPEDAAQVERANAPGTWPTDRMTVEYRVLGHDSSTRWFRDHRILDETGPPAIVSVALDITSLRKREEQARAQGQLRDLISQVSSSLLASHDVLPNGAIKVGLGGLGRRTGSTRALALTFRDERLHLEHEWHARTHRPCPTATFTGRQLSEFSFISRRIASDRWVAIWNEDDLPEDATAEQALLDDLGASTFAAIPMRVDGRLLGLVWVFDLKAPSEEHEILLTHIKMFADALAAGLQRIDTEAELVRAHEALRKGFSQQRQLLDASTQLSHALDLEEVFAILESQRTVLGADYIACVTTESQSSDAMLHTIVPARRETVFPEQQSEAAISQVLSTERPFSTRTRPISMFSDLTDIAGQHGLEHLVLSPMQGVHSSIGVLIVGRSGGGPVTRDEEVHVAQLGALAAARLSSLRSQGELEQLNRDLESRVVNRTAALQASEGRLQRLFRYAPHAMLMVNQRGLVIRSNRGAQLLFGYSESGLNSLPVDDLLPPELREIDLLAPGNEQSNVSVVPGLRRDGEVFDCEIGLVSLEIDNETHLLVGVSDVSERIAAQQALKRSVQDKETLLKEIHHRVKNNLQIISSLLMLQSTSLTSKEAKAVFAESVYRVRSMALIHQQLYGVHRLERIDLGEYATALSTALQSTLAPETSFEVDASSVFIGMDQAVPVGLVLNELLTNALKYGASSSTELPPGRVHVHVSVRQTGDSVRLAVWDAGPGLPPDFDPRKVASLGMQLIRSLSRQLRATFTLENDDGARAILEWRTNDAVERPSLRTGAPPIL